MIRLELKMNCIYVPSHFTPIEQKHGGRYYQCTYCKKIIFACNGKELHEKISNHLDEDMLFI